MRKRLLISCVVIIAAIFPASRFPGSEAAAAARASISRPRLVVVITIDQGRYDYLQRFRPEFVARGFNLLLSGASFTDCRYDYATTITGPGHATLFTGAYPNLHGIIENSWWDRAAHHSVYCVADSNTQEVDAPNGSGGPGASPRRLMADTLGDELRMASNYKSKVVAISLKDRSAVLPGGHDPNGAYWWDDKDGHFVTSTYYTQNLPGWVERFNAGLPAKPYCGEDWRALPETPDVGGKVLGAFKGSANEACPDSQFTHWLHGTPYMNEIELKFAEAAIAGEHLGRGPATDLLAISLSVNDVIGHGYGPYSGEVADVTLRTDRYLADFFRSLDQSVGLSNVWMALSADHGVSPNPDYITQHRLGPGSGAFPEAVKTAVENALNAAFGEGAWVESVTEFYLYFNQNTIREHHADEAKVESIAAEAAVKVPGIREAFTRTELMTGALPHSPLARKASNSFNNQRSGDLFLIREPFALPEKPGRGTTHGSPWNYDAQVPLVLWGSAFKSGAYATPCQPIDLAATLTAALGLTQPSDAQGHPLTVALR